jgi:chemotaxis protein MotB
MDLASFCAVDEVGAMVAKEVEKNASEVEEFVFKNKLAGQVDVSSDERGVIITLFDTVLFPAGKSIMTLLGNDLIKQVFDLLQQFNYNVKIEGHTDKSPIRIKKFPSNWELSAACAAEVARELLTARFPSHAILC